MCSSAVERPLRMRKVQGSNPCSSSLIFCLFFCKKKERGSWGSLRVSEKRSSSVWARVELPSSLGSHNTLPQKKGTKKSKHKEKLRKQNKKKRNKHSTLFFCPADWRPRVSFFFCLRTKEVLERKQLKKTGKLDQNFCTQQARKKKNLGSGN